MKSLLILPSLLGFMITGCGDKEVDTAEEEVEDTSNLEEAADASQEKEE